MKMTIGAYISIITLNVNGLNAPTERHRIAEWIQKQDLYIYMLSTRNHFRPKVRYRLKVKGKLYSMQIESKNKKVKVAILISDKADLK